MLSLNLSQAQRWGSICQWADLHPVLSPQHGVVHKTNLPMEVHQARSNFWNRINFRGSHPTPFSVGQSFALSEMLVFKVLVPHPLGVTSGLAGLCPVRCQPGQELPPLLPASVFLGEHEART